MVYAVNGTDTGNHGTILQATTDFTTSVVSFKIGGAAAGAAADAILYSGAFDNAYYDSAIPSIAGHMYVCGKDPAANNRPAIYQLSFAPATAVLTSVGTPLTGLVTANNRACSPMTEFVNGTPTSTDDWIFFSVGNSSNDSAGTPLVGPCAATATGCLISINVAGEPAWPPAAVSNTATLPGLAAGATSGIVAGQCVHVRAGLEHLLLVEQEFDGSWAGIAELQYHCRGRVRSQIDPVSIAMT